MILRQLIVRHGRTVLATSTRRIARRCYATEIDVEGQPYKPSKYDKPQRPIPGHPDEPSSLLDAIGHSSTPRTAAVEQAVEQSRKAIDSIFETAKTISAAQNHGIVSQVQTPAYSEIPESPYKSLDEMYAIREHEEEARSKGTDLANVYVPDSLVTSPPTADEITLEMLLANQCHLGHATALWHPGNSNYIFGVRHGIHIISLELTLSYLRRATRVIREVARKGGIILFVGTRKRQRDIVVKSARRATGYHVFQRWIPGSLTNGQQIYDKCAIRVVNSNDDELEAYRENLSNSSHRVLRPDLVVCLNPQENEVCLHECGVYNVPTIGIIDTDTNPTWVTYPIPANDDSLRSVALIAGALSRAAAEGTALRLEKGKLGRTTYNREDVLDFLENMEEMSKLNVEVGEGAAAKESA